MPTLKYRDPADGTYKVVPGGSSGGGGVPIYADEAARDAAIPAPTEGQQCYLLNRKANCICYDGVWHPAPASSTTSLNVVVLANYPGDVTRQDGLITPRYAGGFPLGVASGSTFTVTYAGWYQVEITGVAAVPGDGVLLAASGALLLEAGEVMQSGPAWTSYPTLTAHWVSAASVRTDPARGTVPRGSHRIRHNYGNRRRACSTTGQDRARRGGGASGADRGPRSHLRTDR